MNIRKVFYLIAKLLPDKIHLQLMYYYHFNRFINFKSPKTFNEKLQWLKLYDRKPEYTLLVDKIEVKDWVGQKIGREHIIPTLGVWNNAEDIDFAKLPNQFVLKTNHSGGSSGVIICKDKSLFDKEAAIRKLNKSLKTNTYLYGREWPYKNVKRRILAEQFMSEGRDEDLKDYKYYFGKGFMLSVKYKRTLNRDLCDFKFFCFNGEPRLCQVITDRSTDEKIDFYDMAWQRLSGLLGLVGKNNTLHNSRFDIPCPFSFCKMKEMASILSKGIPFSRIDFYEINKKPYFGEITFYPASGFGEFRPVEWNIKIGAWLNLKSD